MRALQDGPLVAGFLTAEALASQGPDLGRDQLRVLGHTGGFSKVLSLPHTESSGREYLAATEPPSDELSPCGGPGRGQPGLRIMAGEARHLLTRKELPLLNTLSTSGTPSLDQNLSLLLTGFCVGQ